MLRPSFTPPRWYRLLAYGLFAVSTVSFTAHASYNTCGTTIVSSTVRTCSDGLIARVHTGDPFMVSTNSVDFGNVEVGQTSTRTITLSNNSGYDVGISGNITISSAFLTGSTSNCGQNLANGGTCSINVKFAPSAAGLVSGQVQIPFVSATSPYAIALKGTGVAATPVAPVPTAPVSPTHATKLLPSSCISTLGSSSGLDVPFFTFNGSPMWGKLTSTGTLLSYKLSDYGLISGTGSATCIADGGRLDIGTIATMRLAHLYYSGNYYTATLQLVGVDKDGFFLFNIVAADTYRAPVAPTTPTTPTTTPAIDHSILVGNWALHYGVSTVTFLADGTYSSANGGTGTYRWEGDKLFINGALTSGSEMEAVLDVTASATWLTLYFNVSGYTVRTDYYKMN